jgi:protein-tyrosine phosphatase
MPNNDDKQPQRVLFLCTGNYYRSRFAEIVFNWQAEKRQLNWLADSRGLALDVCNNGPISRHTIGNLKSRGIASDTCDRSPLPVTEEDFAAADRIIAVKEAEHRPMVEQKFPEWRDRVEYWHVHDIDCAAPDTALPHLEREVVRLLDRLAA